MKIIKSLTQLNENTIILVLHDNIRIDHDSLKNGLLLLDEFTQKRSLKRLTIVGENIFFTLGALKSGLTEIKKRTNYTIAEAIVVQTLRQKIIATFYSKYFKVKSPIKHFTYTEDAIQWLHTIRN